MNKDNRISNLNRREILLSDDLALFPSSPAINESGNQDADILFLITNSGSHNEKIKYKNLKSSILDNSVFLTGDQLISGEKTFADTCTFLGTTYINEIIDITQTGDISGNNFVSTSGIFESIESNTLYVSGNSNFIGNLSHSGSYTHEGQFNLIGDVHQTGNAYINGNQSVTGDIYLGGSIYSATNNDTYISFVDPKIELSANNDSKIILNELGNQDIKFITSGEQQMVINESGSIGINNSDPFGELCVSGESYLENLFVTGLNGEWKRVYGGKDRTLTFVTELVPNNSSYTINFTEPFAASPVINISLENNGGPIVPYIISNINGYSYDINFASELGDYEYKVHTSARSQSDEGFNSKIMQSFSTELLPSGGVNIYEIFYPNPFNLPPVVTTTIEKENAIIPYFISGITNSSYKIIFGRDLDNSCKIHTHAVR